MKPSTQQRVGRKLTEEEAIILDCWYQWAYETKRGRYAGGLSALEGCESYLREHKIINSLGNKAKNIIW